MYLSSREGGPREPAVSPATNPSTLGCRCAPGSPAGAGVCRGCLGDLCPLKSHNCPFFPCGWARGSDHSAVPVSLPHPSELQRHGPGGQLGFVPGADTEALRPTDPLLREASPLGGGESGAAESHLSWPRAQGHGQQHRRKLSPRESRAEKGSREGPGGKLQEL